MCSHNYLKFKNKKSLNNDKCFLFKFFLFKTIEIKISIFDYNNINFITFFYILFSSHRFDLRDLFLPLHF